LWMKVEILKEKKENSTWIKALTTKLDVGLKMMIDKIVNLF
jgi:hypothetical protein